MSAVLEMREPSGRYLETLPLALVQRFELLATAPGGVTRLRDLILSLAMQGKVAKQDPRDEPATDLLRRIRSERESLAAAGLIKNARAVAPISLGDEPCALPRGWAWVRFGDLIHELCTGPFGSLIHKEDYVSGGVPLVNPSHMINGRIEHDPDVSVSALMASQLTAYQLSVGDVLLARRGEMGRYALVTEREAGWLCGTGSFFLKLFKAYDRRFFGLTLEDPRLRRHLLGESVGATMTNLNQRILLDAVVAVAPLAEQARIVARVDELMRLCDALEAKGRLEAEQHARLLGTLLGTLTDSSTPEELTANWQRVADHFDLLLDRPEAVDAVEQTILQLAVRGLLVPQNANDETASDLLARARAEKERLIRAGELRDQKPLAEIDDVPFDIPRAWAWARLGELGISFDYGSSQKSCDDIAAVPILRMGNVQAGRLVFGNLKFLKDQKEELPGLLLEEGDLLFNRTNSFELVGKTGLFEGFGRPVTFASYLIRIRPNKSLCDPRYMNTFMNTQDCRKTEIEPDLTQQTGQANYNGTKLRNIRVPLPPREEQTRIVARVTELRRLCTDLRHRLDRSRTTQTSVADALVEQALSA
jgi:type I restriction enzyme, S subunit